MHQEPVLETDGKKSLGPVLRGAAHLLSANVFRIVIQALYAVIIARGA